MTETCLFILFGILTILIFISLVYICSAFVTLYEPFLILLSIISMIISGIFTFSFIKIKKDVTVNLKNKQVIIEKQISFCGLKDNHIKILKINKIKK